MVTIIGVSLALRKGLSVACRQVAVVSVSGCVSGGAVVHRWTLVSGNAAGPGVAESTRRARVSWPARGPPSAAMVP